MNTINYLKYILTALVILITTVTVQAQNECNDLSLELPGEYNALIFGDFDATSSSAEGRLAVMGDANISNYSIGQRLTSTTAGDSLIIGGDLNYSSGRIYHGNVVVAGTANLGNQVLNSLSEDQTVSDNAELPIDFTELKQQLLTISDALTDLNDNGTYTHNNKKFVLTGDNTSALQVFTLNGDDVLLAHTFKVNDIPDDATIVLNISGANVGLTQMSLQDLNSYGSHTLFNFYEAQSLTFTGIQVEGSILAPNAIVNDAKGSVDGMVVVASWEGKMKLNYTPFVGCFEGLNIAPVAQDAEFTTDEDTAIPTPLIATDIGASTLEYIITQDPENGTLTGQAPDYLYTPNENFNGIDQFSYKVNDGQLDSNSATVTITVNPINDAPVAQDATLTTNEDTPLTIILQASDVDADPLTYTILTNPENGILTGTAQNLTLTPDENFNGDVSFTFQVTDGTLTSEIATISITINPVNDAPIVENVAVTTDEDLLISILLLASDVDADALNYSITTPPEHGTISGEAPNLTYTPQENYNGNDQFEFMVNDGLLDSNLGTVSITINPVNDAPVVENIAVTTDEDLPTAILLTASDVDEDALNYSITTPPEHGTLSGNAPNLTYTPQENYNGNDQFEFMVNDGLLDSNLGIISITINPVNDTPVVENIIVETDEDLAANIILLASDIDGDNLSYTITIPPQNGSLSGEAPNLTYTPQENYNGSDQIEFMVNDGMLDSNLGTVSITVSPVNDAPIVQDAEVATGEDTPLTITLQANDADGDTLTYNILTNPANGTLTGTAPNLTFTPDENFYGSVSFTYQVTDGTLISEIATISITINSVNDAPVAQDNTVTTNEDTVVNIVLQGSDIENTNLNYEIMTSPLHGTISGTPPTISYTPDIGFYGSDQLRFRVNDGDLISNVATVGITIIPVIGALVITAPSNGALFDGDKAIVYIQASIRETSPSVEVNGIIAERYSNDETKYKAEINLVLGVNTILAIANYDNGEIRTDEITLNYIQVPQITFTSPIDWQTLGVIGGAGGATNLTGVVERPVTITGTISSPAIEVQINQQQAQLSSDGMSFEFEDFFLHEGTNMLNATATDEYDRQSNAQITVYVDQSAPLLSVTNIDGRMTSANRIDITGTVNDALGADFNAPVVNVSIGNAANGSITVAQVSGLNYIAQNVPLAVGNNPLLITATDGYENSRDIIANIVRIGVGSKRITLFTGNRQSGAANTQLQESLIIAAIDKDGLPLVDWPIHFDIHQGSGTISNQSNSVTFSDGINPARNLIINTDNSGQAQVWLTLGEQAGLANNIIRAYSRDLAEDVYFSASITRGEPTKVLIEGASGTQYAQTNSQPVEALTAVVMDNNNNPIANTPVVFTITQGDAYFTQSSSPNGQVINNGKSIQTTTDNFGQASSRPLMGGQSGNVTIVAQADVDKSLIGQATYQIIVLKRTDGPTSFSGVAMDHTGVPIQGIQFSIARTNLTALSDENGNFSFPSNVPTGKIDLFVDGREVQAIQNGENIEYPALHFETAIIQGQNNQLPHPVYLPPVHIDNTKIVGGNQDVTLTIPGFEGFKMIVKANSVTFPDGSTIGELVVNPVHNDRLPMVPPGTGGRFMATGWTLQPTGTRFDPPIEVHIPNTDGLKPGITIPVVQWDHDLAYFVPMGQGTISEDGIALVTNKGSGITKAGWGGGPPPIPPNDAECENGTNKATGQTCGCEVTIKADGEEDELWKPFDNDGVNVNFVAELATGCGNASALWTFGDVSLPELGSLTTSHEYIDFDRFKVKVEVFCPTCENTTDTINVNIFQIVLIAPISIYQAEDEVETEFLANWTGGQVDDRREIKAIIEPTSDSITINWNVDSIPTAAGIAASADPNNGTGEEFTFIPNVEHRNVNTIGTFRGQFGSIDTSDPIEYTIKAEINNIEVELKIIQDEKSIILQEYITHNIENQGGAPTRGDLNTPTIGGNFNNIDNINWTDYNVIPGDPRAIAQNARDAFNLAIQTELTLANTPDYGLVLTGTWRNPERNDFFQGQLLSVHLWGDAIDIGIDNINSVMNTTNLTRTRLWEILDSVGDVIGLGICEVNGRQRVCSDPNITHVHINL